MRNYDFYTVSITWHKHFYGDDRKATHEECNKTWEFSDYVTAYNEFNLQCIKAFNDVGFANRLNEQQSILRTICLKGMYLDTDGNIASDIIKRQFYERTFGGK